MLVSRSISSSKISPCAPRRREASPEGPARALKNPLMGQVTGPPVGTMEGVAIALDGKSSVVGPFHDHVQTIDAALHPARLLPT